MGWLGKIFGISKGPSFKECDWLAAESAWRQVEQLAKSHSQADKKQAIIEADNIVAQLLEEAQVKGSNFGERLKNLKTKMDYKTYRKLWQAHLKRNELVHQAGSFVADWELKTYLPSFKEGMDNLRRIR